MKLTTGELAVKLEGVVHGDSLLEIESVADLQTAGPRDLAYAEPKFQDHVSGSKAACVIVSGGEYPSRTVLVVKHPKLAFARAAEWLLGDQIRPAPGIHPSATLAADVHVGQRVHIGAGCTIASGVSIGDDSVLYANVTVYRDVRIGKRTTIHSGAVIGADGFGFVFDGERYTKFPQIGGVWIEDDVEIGSNTTIDRGSLGTTHVGEGTKIDNLCQIAHNVDIGRHVVIAAQTGISGSCVIGDHALIGGQVGFGDHCRVDAKAIIGSGAGIPTGKRIRAGEVYWGTPARPLKDVKLQHAYLSRLPKILKELDELRKRLG